MQCEFYRYGAEKISLNGIINDYSKFENLNISISNIPLSEFNDFIADADVNEIQSLDGKVRKLNITFNDTFDNTQINIHSQIDSLNINNNYIGNIESKLNHRNHFISGNISAIPNATDKFNFNLDILSFPYNLSISTNDNRLSQTLPFDIDLKLTNLPLSILNPFIPAIEQLSGFASANLKFYGFAPDDLDYSGNIKLSAASFITEATNIKYYAEGNIDIAPQSIYLNHILLKNTSQDLPDGKAIITGSVKLNNTFDIEYIDILVRSDKILILNDASIKNIPYLYGNFIIATGDNPLHFFGTLDEPELTGDLNILLANLKMPQETAAASPKTIFRYEIFNPLTNITYSFPESTDNLNKNLIPGDTIQISDNSIQNYKEKDNPDFADIINYDLNIRFYGRFDVMMDMQAIFQLYANIGTYDRNIPIRYIKKRGKSEPTLLGDLYVKEGSQLNYLRTFKTKGLILFPTGSISNPGLNLEAIYTGLSYSNDKTFNYIVKIFITGTKENPNIKLTYSIDGDEPKDDSTQVTKDALSLLLFGKTFKDIQGGNGINLSDIANDAIYSGLSAGGSYLLNELFTGNGFIKNADIDLTGGIKEARLKLTGQLFGLGIEAGGTIADLASNSQISFIVPLSSLLNLSAINFNAQFTGTINPNTSQSSEQKDWEFKMNFGKRW